MSTAASDVEITDAEWDLYAQHMWTRLEHRSTITQDPERVAQLIENAPDFVSAFGVRPVSVDEPVGGDSSWADQLAPEVAEAVRGHGRSYHDLFEAAREAVEDKANSLKGKDKPSPDSWASDMHAIEARMSKKALEIIHAIIQKLIDRGNAHPGERKDLKAAAEKIAGFFDDVGNGFIAAFNWLAEKLEWLWDKLKEAGKWVWDRMKELGHTIAHFFGF